MTFVTTLIYALMWVVVVSEAVQVPCYTITLHCEINALNFELKCAKNMLQRSTRLSRNGIVASFSYLVLLSNSECLITIKVFFLGKWIKFFG